MGFIFLSPYSSYAARTCKVSWSAYDGYSTVVAGRQPCRVCLKRCCSTIITCFLCSLCSNFMQNRAVVDNSKTRTLGTQLNTRLIYLQPYISGGLWQAMVVHATLPGRSQGLCDRSVISAGGRCPCSEKCRVPTLRSSYTCSRHKVPYAPCRTGCVAWMMGGVQRVKPRQTRAQIARAARAVVVRIGRTSQQAHRVGSTLLVTSPDTGLLRPWPCCRTGSVWDALALAPRCGARRPAVGDG